MAKKKYVRDYEISETIDEKGRVRSVPIYVGSYFCFCDAAAAKKTSGTRLAEILSLCRAADLEVKSESTDYGRLRVLFC